MRPHVITALLATFTILIVFSSTSLAAEQALSVDQLVAMAVEVNPQLKAARARWFAAQHAIRQHYAPVDPLFSFTNLDSPTTGFDHASVHALQVTESFQFPGKAVLQADEATRQAEIARLSYVAAIRDIRAETEVAFYQDVLDDALAQITAENVANLKRVLEVTQVAYSASQVTQTDFISAEFDLAAAQQQERQLKVAENNDRTTLNELLYRRPDEPLNLDRKIELNRLQTPLDSLVDRAAEVRQEILEAAAAERNAATALQLAKLEYAPDYTVGYIFDHYLLPSAAPAPTRTQDHGFAIGFNVPIFFWLHQNEDVQQAGYDLEAARDDLGSIKSQTAAVVTTLYRTAQYAFSAATLYRDTLIPLARQDFEVALVAYSLGKVDFVTLSGALRRAFDARVAYLQAANQYLAGRVALEQAIGEPLSR
jgi:outer membrane protein, heavy metal efflux system